MLLNALAAEGLAGGPLALEVSGRVARVADAARAAEALELAAAGLDPGRLAGFAERFGLGGSIAAADGSPELQDVDPVAVGRIVEPGWRHVTIELSLALDPTLFGRLREQVGREPRLGPALADGAGLTVKVGWWWARDQRGGSGSVLAVRVGDVPLETAGKERLPFLTDLLLDVARRLRTTDPFERPEALAARLARAAAAPVPAERAGWAQVRDAAARAPFALPTPELVVVDGRAELRFGPELASDRRAGRAAVDVVRWLAALHVAAPDVLLVPEPVPDAVLAAWRERLEAADAPVEQVLVG